MTLAEYAFLAEGLSCISCNMQFASPIIISFYPHKEGWFVYGYKKRQWLYITCTFCGYETALWKLGIGGSLNKCNRKIAKNIVGHSRILH